MKNQRKKRFCSIIALITMVVLTGMVSEARAKVVKLSTVQMPHMQMGKISSKFAEIVNNDSQLKKHVQIRVYPSAQLFGGKEEIQALSRGELEMAFVVGGRLQILDSAFEFYELPFLFPSIDASVKIMKGDIGKQIFGKLAKHNIVSLGSVFSGSYVISNSKRPLLMPADFANLKLRSHSRLTKSILESLGATAVVIASEEVFSSLQQGVIDGLITPNEVYLRRKYFGIQKHVTDTGMLNYAAAILLANTDFWNGLPADVRGKLAEIIEKVITENHNETVGNDKNYFKEIESKGNIVYHLTAQQKAAWEAATKVIYDKFGPAIGMDVIQRIQAQAKSIK
ncbi:MAG: TRAP transporter substrate-binding protein [Desulfobacterales bacterium]|nr:TRAP transporter substrate-binding protein [Desulfobacterales bacterium]